MTINIPWSEKYRPNDYNNIMFDNSSKQFFDNLLNNNYFPNLLFYGPPGTGKTTTIINLINKFQELYSKKSNSLIIHLNASDDRGIDIIRNNINNFVKSNNLFDDGSKFIILDEVDYMTKIAQLALKCLIQENNKNIKYCLICNYISKIDYSLQSEFIKVRFNKISKELLTGHLINILKKENILHNDSIINNIIDYYDTDIRSMLNFIQSNNKKNLLTNKHLSTIYKIHLKKDFSKFKKYLDAFLINNNFNINVFIKKYINYLINNIIYQTNNNDLTVINEKLMYYEYIIHNINSININNQDIFIKIIYDII